VPTKTWVVGEEVLAADFNTFVQKQVVATFANAAARDAAIPSPTPGTACYLNDLGQLQIYTDKAPAPGWYRPWTQPWGQTHSAATSDLTFSTPQFVPGATIPLPVAGRLYKAEFEANIRKTDAVIGTVTVLFQQNAVQGIPAMYSLSPNYAIRVVLTDVYVGGGASLGVVVQCDSGVATLSWARVHAYDVGSV